LLGPVLVAASLAVFAMEHLLAADLLVGLVPAWIPAPLFWTYLVGVAHVAAAVSLALRIYVRWSALLLAVMFVVFVVTMDLPAVIQDPHERLSWTLMLRQTAFAGGAMALAGAARRDQARFSSALIAIGRTCLAVPSIVFGIEHLAVPATAPGVPLTKLSPGWVPVPHLWAYAVGALLIVAGLGMLVDRRTRLAATSVGCAMVFLVLALYLPLLVMAHGTSQALVELNYVGDTLLFAGTALLVVHPPARRT
jgi:uncharacterized membrane protein YphA (DoxX/SURF4 family)